MHEKSKAAAPALSVVDAKSDWNPDSLATPSTVFGPPALRMNDQTTPTLEGVVPDKIKTQSTPARHTEWGLAATSALGLWLLGAAAVFLHWLWGVRSVRVLKTRASLLAQPESFCH